MSSRWFTSVPARKGPMGWEIATLCLVLACDAALVLLEPRATGIWSALLRQFVPGVDTAAVLLALLRRRFPQHLARLAWSVVALSALSSTATAVAAAMGVTGLGYPVVAETGALALFVGAGCCGLPSRAASALTAASGLVMAAGPLARFGFDSAQALLAVPAALLCGGAWRWGWYCATPTRAGSPSWKPCAPPNACAWRANCTTWSPTTSAAS